MPTAFITYAHDTEEHKDKVLALANKLREDGIDVSIDVYNPHPAEGWPKWMEKQFASDYILVVMSAKYIRDFNQEIDNASGGRYEGALLSAKLLRQGADFSNIAVICFEEFREVQIPDVLYGCTRYFPENQDEYKKLYSFLTKQPHITKPELGKIVSFAAVDTFKKLCALIWPLMEENRRIFEDFGPNSGASKEEKQVRYDLSIWHSKRAQIVVNNREIRKLIDIGIKVIPEDHRDIFRKWRSHIDAFEVHVERDIDYREHRFPVEIVKIIEGNRFTDFDYHNRPTELRPGDYILIAKPEGGGGANQQLIDEAKIGIGKLAEFMGALNSDKMWKYVPPTDEEKEARRNRRKKYR